MITTLSLIALACVAAPGGAHPPGSVVADYRTTILPGQGGPVMHASIGDTHSAVVFADGTCVVWGLTKPAYSVTNAIPGPFRRVEAGGYGETAAILANGDVVRYKFTHTTIHAGPFKDIGAWGDRTCALRENGTLVWLDGPAPAGAPTSGVFLDLDIFNAHGSAAVRSDGSLVSWGNALDNYPVPSGTFVAVSVSETHGIALTESGEAVCWGDNAQGQCDAPKGPFVAVSAWHFNSVGLREDGSIAQWGDTPTPPPPGVFIAVEASYGGGFALRRDGTLVGWGPSWLNQPPGAAFVDALIRDFAFFPGDYALRADGSLVQTSTEPSWLFPDAGIPGMYSAIASTTSTAAALRLGSVEIVGQGLFGEDIPPTGNFRSLTGGAYHYAALDEAGEAHCWGLNAWGQCDALPGPFLEVTAGAYHTLALRLDGTIAAWGDNTYGQCEPPPGAFVALTAGTAHSVALRADGSVIGWGRNHLGQTNLHGGTAAGIQAVSDSTMVIRLDGSLECVGGWSPLCGGNLAPLAIVSKMSRGITTGPDCDGDGQPNFVELFNGAVDGDGDGTPDACDPMQDLDADGLVGAADLALLLAAWGESGPSDFDGDGLTGPSDLASLLAAWSE
jgi:hypothetical protein